MPAAPFFLLLLAALPGLIHPPCLQLVSAEVSITVIPDSSSYYALSDAAAAYELLSPSVSITVQQPTVTEEDALPFLLNRSVALITTTALIASPSPAAADVFQSPLLLSAIVPVYSFGSSFATTAIALVLSPALLADIFLGNVTHWNDSRITALNPLLSAPSIPIVLVLQQEPASSLSLAFTQCMAAMSAAFASAIGVTASPAFPVSSYAADPVYAAGIAGIPAAVAYTTGGLGITFLPTANAMGSSVAAMVNSAQQVVTASPTTAAFSSLVMIASEAEGIAAAGYNTSWDLLPLSLANVQGQQAWPMTALVLAGVHMLGVNNTQADCEQRAAALSFLLFLYNSALAASLLASREYALLPAEVLSEIGTLDTLTSSYLCNTTTVAQTVAAELGYLSATAGYAEYTLTGDSRYTGLLQQLAYLYSAEQQVLGIAVEFSYVPRDTSSYAFDAVVRGNADLAVLSLEQLLPSQLQQVDAMRDSEQYFFLPFFISALVPIYNMQMSPTFTVPSTLSINVPTLLSIFTFNITDWKSPALASCGAFTASTPNVSLPLTIVGSCDPDDAGWSVRDWLTMFTPWSPALWPLLLDPSSIYYEPCNGTVLASLTNLVEAEIPSEAAAPAVLNALYGSLGYTTAAASYTTGVMSVDFGDGPLNASVDSMLACMDSFDAATLTATVNASTDPACYQFSRTLYVMVPRSYQDTEQDGCSDAQALLQLLQWIVSGTQLDAAMEQVLLLRTAALPAIQTALTAALNSVTCVDPLTGESSVILVTLPVVWSMSRAVTITGVVLGSVGALCSLSALITTAAFHRHSAMRASSPIFLILTLLGLSVFFLAPIFLSLPPSSASCSGLAWTANLGFMLCFAPLFAKTYRVYRIYGGSKLTVVKLSNERLLLMTAALLLLELALLLTWQLLSPMQPLTIVQTEGSRQYQYGQCSVQDSGLVLFILLCAEKGVMLVFGALMAFSTRRVSAQYSESGGIAWSIYNVVLSVAVLTPIVLLTQAVGDTEALLLDFLLLWIGSFTLCVLFVPRLSVLLLRQAETQQLDAHDAGERVSSGAFSFLSLASFDSSHAVAQYLAALEMHLLQAKNRYGMTRVKGDVSGSRAPEPTHNRQRSTIEGSIMREGSSLQLKARSRVSTTAQPPKGSLSYMTQTAPTVLTPTSHGGAATAHSPAANGHSGFPASDDGDRPGSKFITSAGTRATKTPLLPRSSTTLSASPSPSSKVAPHPQHVTSAAAESVCAEESKEAEAVASGASLTVDGSAAASPQLSQLSGVGLLAGAKRRSSGSLSSRSAKVTPLPQPATARTSSLSSTKVDTAASSTASSPHGVTPAAALTQTTKASESSAGAEVVAGEQTAAAPTVAELLAASMAEPELLTASDLHVDDLSARQPQSEDEGQDRDDDAEEPTHAPHVRAASKKIQLLEVTQQPLEAADGGQTTEPAQHKAEEKQEEPESSILKTERLEKLSAPDEAEAEQEQ